MGRKKMKTTAPEKLEVRMRVDADLMKQIQEVADENGLAVAAWIRSTVIRELKRIRREEGES